METAMYVHIGEDVALRASEIVAIVDARLAHATEVNQEFFRRAAAAGRLRGERLSDARSVVVTIGGLYPSPISSVTLARRVRGAVREQAIGSPTA
jgi:hypothetical protein